MDFLTISELFSLVEEYITSKSFIIWGNADVTVFPIGIGHVICDLGETRLRLCVRFWVVLDLIDIYPMWVGNIASRWNNSHTPITEILEAEIISQKLLSNSD